MSFFSNSKGWPLVTLKDIATLKRGYDLPSNSRIQGDIPIYAANGQNGTHNEAKFSGPGIITGRSGTIGKVHFSGGAYWPLNTALYVTNFNGNDPKWIYYMLQAFKLERFVQGAGVPTLNRNLVHGELIPIPPLAEQKRIAAILDKADAIRRKRKQAIQLADDFLRSVFLDMFGDPVTNPKGIKLSKFSSIAEFINGDRSSNYPSGSDLIAQGVLFLNTKNIVKNQLDFKNQTFISQEKFDSLSRGKLQRGDLVITLRGTLGSCAIFDTEFETGFINAQIMILRCKEKVLPEYLHALLTTKSFHSMLQRIGQGAAVPQLTATQLKSLNLPIPTIELQKKFIDILSNYKGIINRFDGNNASYLFNSLSQKAFAGEL